LANLSQLSELREMALVILISIFIAIVSIKIYQKLSGSGPKDPNANDEKFNYRAFLDDTTTDIEQALNDKLNTSRGQSSTEGGRESSTGVAKRKLNFGMISSFMRRQEDDGSASDQNGLKTNGF